jgi:uncharacterized protein (DUF362 family)
MVKIVSLIQIIINHTLSNNNVIKPNDKVLIKPNMVDGVKKELSVTTHP